LSGSTTISFSRAVLSAVMNVQDDYKDHLRWMSYSLAETRRRFPDTAGSSDSTALQNVGNFQIHYTASDLRSGHCKQFRSRYRTTDTVGHTINISNKTVSQLYFSSHTTVITT